MISCLLIYHSSTETQTGENYPELLEILSEDDAKRIRMASEFDQVSKFVENLQFNY
jgi:hypothetical protein